MHRAPSHAKCMLNFSPAPTATILVKASALQLLFYVDVLMQRPPYHVKNCNRPGKNTYYFGSCWANDMPSAASQGVASMGTMVVQLGSTCSHHGLLSWECRIGEISKKRGHLNKIRTRRTALHLHLLLTPRRCHQSCKLGFSTSFTASVLSGSSRSSIRWARGGAAGCKRRRSRGLRARVSCSVCTATLSSRMTQACCMMNGLSSTALPTRFLEGLGLTRL